MLEDQQEDGTNETLLRELKESDKRVKKELAIVLIGMAIALIATIVILVIR